MASPPRWGTTLDEWGRSLFIAYRSSRESKQGRSSTVNHAYIHCMHFSHANSATESVHADRVRMQYAIELIGRQMGEPEPGHGQRVGP